MKALSVTREYLALEMDLAIQTHFHVLSFTQVPDRPLSCRIRAITRSGRLSRLVLLGIAF